MKQTKRPVKRHWRFVLKSTLIHLQSSYSTGNLDFFYGVWNMFFTLLKMVHQWISVKDSHLFVLCSYLFLIAESSPAKLLVFTSMHPPDERAK